MAQKTTKENTQPSYLIMICLIQIWDPDGVKNLLSVPSKTMLIAEAESIEIDESYRELIGTATVKFPRGTVVRKTISEENIEDIVEDKKLQARISDNGVVEVTRAKTVIAVPETFAVGQRIRISLGYTRDPEIAKLGKVLGGQTKNIFNDNASLEKYRKALHMMFDGYITKVSMETPIELKCENLASNLKKITCKKIQVSTVNDVLADDGKCKLLKNTGLILHPQTKAEKYDLGKIQLTTTLTVADVLNTWKKYGLISFVTEYQGKPAIAVGRTYFSEAGKDSILNLRNNINSPIKVLFDYNVADSNLTYSTTDHNFLAVEAEGVSKDKSNSFFHLTILKNPEYDSSNPKSPKYRVVNESKSSKKKMKGVQFMKASENKVDMSLYTKIPYHSRKFKGISREDLVKEAIKYFESYNMNGIEGNVTLFGDFSLHTATEVQLIDNRYPHKNGYYLVDEVHTTFGTNGYRQDIQMPYCIKRDKKDKKK